MKKLIVGLIIVLSSSVFAESLHDWSSCRLESVRNFVRDTDGSVSFGDVNSEVWADGVDSVLVEVSGDEANLLSAADVVLSYAGSSASDFGAIEVWSDAKMRFYTESVEWFGYEGEYPWLVGTSSRRVWIIIPVKKDSLFRTPRLLRVALSGTDTWTPYCVIRSWASTTIAASKRMGFPISSDGVYYSSDSDFELSGDDGVPDNIHHFGNDEDGFRVTVTTPSAGVLVALDPSGQGSLSVYGATVTSVANLPDADYFWEAGDIEVNVSGPGKVLFDVGRQHFNVSGFRFFRSDKPSMSVMSIAKWGMKDSTPLWMGYVVGSGTYVVSNQVVIEAISAKGAVFDHWEVIGGPVPSDFDVTKAKATFKVTSAMCGEAYPGGRSEYTFVANWRPMQIVETMTYTPVGGTVSGNAFATEGTDVKLSAKAALGYVFAGWFTDLARTQPLVGDIDDRTPSITYVISTNDVTLYAKFIPASEDTGIALTADDGAGARDVTTNATETVFNFNTSGALELALLAESQSLPKITVSGLPVGLRFTAKPVYVTGSKTEVAYAANTIYGTATKPGTYVVTVKLTNATVKKAIERKFTIVVDNFTGANGLLAVSDREGSPAELLNARGDKYVVSVGVLEFNLPRLLAMNGLDRVTLTGLPSGLRYNAMTGAIQGVATKAGTFTVSVKVGIAVSTFTIQVEALPSWLIGAYEVGCYEIFPDDTLYDISAVKWVIGASGSVAGKVIFAWPDKVSTESFTFKLTRKDEDGAFWIEGYEYDEAPGVFSIRIYPTVVDGVEIGRVEAAFEAWGSSGPSNSYTVYMQGAKDVWTKFREGSPARPLFSQGCSYYFADDDANVFLKLVFGNDGNVKVFNYADASDTTAYSTASARLVPYEVQGDSLKAYCSFVIQGRYHAIGLVLNLSINTSYGTVYDGDIVVDEYHLQYAD